MYMRRFLYVAAADIRAGIYGAKKPVSRLAGLLRYEGIKVTVRFNFSYFIKRTARDSAIELKPCRRSPRSYLQPYS